MKKVFNNIYSFASRWLFPTNYKGIVCVKRGIFDILEPLILKVVNITFGDIFNKLVIIGPIINLFCKFLSIIGYFINFYTPIKWLLDQINFHPTYDFSLVDDWSIEADIFLGSVPECGMEITCDLIDKTGNVPVLLDPWIPWIEALVQATVVIS